jgi:hypothetical protein
VIFFRTAFFIFSHGVSRSFHSVSQCFFRTAFHGVFTAFHSVFFRTAFHGVFFFARGFIRFFTKFHKVLISIPYSLFDLMTF